MYFCPSRFLKKRKMYVQADKSWLPAFHFTANFVFWQTYIMSRSSFVHFLTQTTFLNYNLNYQYLHESISHGKKLFLLLFLYKSSIVFHQNNFFELRWDYTSNIVSLQCRFFVSIPSISNFQDKVKVARLDLFFLCVFPAFYVGFLLAYWIHFINRFLSIFKWSPENYENMETFLFCLQVL